MKMRPKIMIIIKNSMDKLNWKR